MLYGRFALALSIPAFHRKIEEEEIDRRCEMNRELPVRARQYELLSALTMAAELVPHPRNRVHHLLGERGPRLERERVEVAGC